MGPAAAVDGLGGLRCYVILPIVRSDLEVRTDEVVLVEGSRLVQYRCEVPE
jgi:hypothetical protein